MFFDIPCNKMYKMAFVFEVLISIKKCLFVQILTSNYCIRISAYIFFQVLINFKVIQISWSKETQWGSPVGNRPYHSTTRQNPPICPPPLYITLVLLWNKSSIIFFNPF